MAEKEKILWHERIRRIRAAKKISETDPPHLQLQRVRQGLGWTQARLAQKLSNLSEETEADSEKTEADSEKTKKRPRPKITSTITISRWEGQKSIPDHYYRRILHRLFGIPIYAWPSEEKKVKANSVNSSAPPLQSVTPQEKPYPAIWNIPFPIPLFVGREDILQELYEILLSGKTFALTQAISGLGGIGKTFTAVQYAYEHRDKYQAVLWIDASTRESFIAGMRQIAHEIHLPAEHLKNQEYVLEAVKQWLKETTGWLLILDNVREIRHVYEFLPTARRGHVLLTTQTQATGDFIENIELSGLSPEHGALLLLRKAKVLRRDAPLEAASQQDREQALHLSQSMDGLPLALDQAGAYIREKHCSLAVYVRLYEAKQMELLRWYNPASFAQQYSYPHSVATTWSISFAEIEQSSLEAVDLLRLYCFLHADAIPEEFVLKGTSVLGSNLEDITDSFAYEQILAHLRRYSFIRYHSVITRGSEHLLETAQMVSIHRLVQAVFRDRMGENAQREWAHRAVLAVEKAFVLSDTTSWDQFQWYLPHVAVCAQSIATRDFRFPEATSLLLQAAQYTREIADYVQSEQYSLQAQEIARNTDGVDHPSFAQSLTVRALLYQHQGLFTKAERLFIQALDIYEHTLSSYDPAIAILLTNLAQCYVMQNKLEEAEPLCLRAINIFQQASQTEYSKIEYLMSTLATIFRERGEYKRAEQLFRQALAVREQEQGPEGLAVAYCLNNLATICRLLAKYAEAEALDLRALAIFQKVYGPEHPDAALCLTCLSDNAILRKNWRQADMLNRQALRIYQKTVGFDDARLVSPLVNLSLVSFCQDQMEEAQDFCKQALTLAEQHGRPDLGEILWLYAIVLEKQGQLEEATTVRTKASCLLGGESKKTTPSAHFDLTRLTKLLEGNK